MWGDGGECVGVFFWGGGGVVGEASPEYLYFYVLHSFPFLSG